MSHYVDGAATKWFAAAMATLAEALGARVTEAQIRVHAKLLSDVPQEALKLAFNRAANELQDGFFPSVGRIRSFLGPTGDDQALISWSALCRATELVGSYASVDVEDVPAGEALLQVFGSWPAFCATDDGPALAIKRQEFLAAYRDARRRQPQHRVGAWFRMPGLLAPPPPELAANVFTGRVAIGGAVESARDSPRLTGGTDGVGTRGRLSEAGAAQADEGAARPEGAQGGQ